MKEGGTDMKNKWKSYVRKISSILLTLAVLFTTNAVYAQTEYEEKNPEGKITQTLVTEDSGMESSEAEEDTPTEEEQPEEVTTGAGSTEETTTEETTTEEERPDELTTEEITTEKDTTSEEDPEETTTEEDNDVGIPEDEEPIETTPNFNPDRHQDQCNYVGSNLGLSATQIAWMTETARAADSKAYEGIKGFHARKGTNYLTNLKALFWYSRLLGKSNDIVTDVINRMPALSSDEKSVMRQMCNAVKSFLESKQGITQEQQKYHVYGFAIHLTGDIFAHRVLIKKSTLDSWNQPDSPTRKNLQAEDFIQATRSQFKEAIRNGQLYMVDMKPYMQPEGFQFKINYPTERTTDRQGEVYIDNPTFMPNRIEAAKKTALSFVQNALNGSFSQVKYYREEYNFTLENFAAYKDKL